MDQRMDLPSVLDLSAASSIKTELNGLRGKSLELDASGVERLGGICLQVLLAARAAWEADGNEFRIANPSEAFIKNARLMAANELVEQVLAS